MNGGGNGERPGAADDARDRALAHYRSAAARGESVSGAQLASLVGKGESTGRRWRSEFERMGLIELQPVSAGANGNHHEEV